MGLKSLTPVRYTTKNQEFEDEQVDLLKALRVVRDGRKTILVITTFFAFFGILHYLTESTEYESKSVLIHETQDDSETQLLIQQVSGSSGFSSESTFSEGIPAGLYREIIYNAEFQQDLLYSDLEPSDTSDTINVFDYLSLLYSSSVTSEVYDTIYRFISNEASEKDYSTDKYLQLSKEETKFIYNLRQRIKLELSDGLITVKTKLPDPVAAASLNTIVVEKLKDYVTQYQIEKAQENLKFTELQYREAKEQYHETQYMLARFSDKNQFLTTALARTQLEELQNNQDLHFDIYNLTSHELEEAKLRVQERKPIFFVLQRPSVSISPVGRSEVVLTIATLLGLLVGIIWVLLRNAFPSFKIIADKERTTFL